MAAVDYFLKIKDIEGESTKEGHKNEIDVEDWHFGVANTPHTHGGGSGAGKAVADDLSFSASYGKASPKLYLACSRGDHIPEAVLTCRKAGGEQFNFMVVTMSDVLIAAYNVSGSGESNYPHDHVTINYAKIKIEYFTQDESGKVKPGNTSTFNFKTGKP